MLEIDPNLIKMFLYLEQEHLPVRLMNAYKGYPVSNDAFTISVSPPYRIRMQVHKYQLICLHKERETIILGDLFTGYIRAQVNHLFVQDLQVDLINLEYNEEKFIQRETERVFPKEPIAVWITLKETKFKIKCELADISIRGLAFLIPIEFYAPHRFRRGEEILINFELPPLGRGQPVELRGKGIIRNTMGATSPDKKRIGLRTQYYDAQAESHIAQYIQYRSQEIVREMDITYAALVRLSQAPES